MNTVPIIRCASFFAQAWAVAVAEFRICLTQPVWAVWLALWTGVSALLFQVTVAAGTSTDLPAGETVMSYFFRFFPGIFPLLLLLFIPHLAMEALAGRRERGRLEHLLVCGLGPGALLAGTYAAMGVLIGLLLMPPVLFHLALARHADLDPGATAAALLVILLEGLALAALDLAASAWLRSRAAAGLVATALGTVWWLADAFAPLLDRPQSLAPLPPLPGLAGPIHAVAGGLLDLGTVAGFLILIGGSLAAAMCGLIRTRLLPGLLTLLAILACTVGLLGHSRHLEWSLDLTLHRQHAVAPATRELVTSLAHQGGLGATLFSTPASRNDPVDGPLLEATRALLLRLSVHGLASDHRDPMADPSATGRLAQVLGLAPAELRRPLLVLRHAGKELAIPAAELGVVEERGQQRRLQAFSGENALVCALRRWRDGQVPRAAWLAGPDCRPLAQVGAWRHQLIEDGAEVLDLPGWSGPLPEVDLLVLPGPRQDPPPEALDQLRRHLQAGRRLLLALDGQDPVALPGLAALMASYGLGWQAACLVTPQGWQGEEPEWLPVVQAQALAEQGPEAFAAREGRMIIVPHAQALLRREPQVSGIVVRSLLPAPASARVWRPGGQPEPADAILPLLLTAESARGGGSSLRLAVLGGVAAFADEHLFQAGNRLLAAGLHHWLLRPSEKPLLPPRPVQPARLDLPPATRAWLRWGAGILLPGLVLLSGLGAWWWRLRR